MRGLLFLLISMAHLSGKATAEDPSLSDSRSARDAVAGPSTGRIACVQNVDGAGREIVAFNTDGTGRTRLSFNTISEEIGADITPDGRVVAFSYFSNIYVMNADGSDVRQLTFTSNNSRPAISRDGAHIAFTRAQSGNTDIYMIDADGSNFHRVTTNQFIDTSPSFSPDGTRLLFHTNRNSQFGLPNLYVINTDGTNETRLTYLFEFDGRFSPDGTKITYSGRPADGQNYFAEVFVMNADGSNPQQLTRLQSSSLAQESPSFSLDGTKIAFERSVFIPNVGSRDQIFIMNVNGSDLQQVTFYGDDPLNPSCEVPRWISSEPPCLPSDGDCDGDLDLGDLGSFLQCFAPGVPATPACEHFDRAGDEGVDLTDFALLADELSGP